MSGCRFANAARFSPGNLLQLARGAVVVPPVCACPLFGHPKREDAPWDSREELCLLVKAGWCGRHKDRAPRCSHLKLELE